MSVPLASFDHLSDQDLLREVTRLAAREREATACLIASLAALERRRLYLAEGYASLFVYCTQALHLSEAAAYKRITAARAARRFPAILERLAEGSVTLATLSLLAPHLTVENHVALLDEVRHRSKRAVEEVVARLQPRPDVPSMVRKLPTPARVPATADGVLARTTEGHRATVPHVDATPIEPSSAPSFMSGTSAQGAACLPTLNASAVADAQGVEARRTPPAAASRGTITPLAPARYKVTVTVGAETYQKLREAQDLLRHIIPHGELDALLDRALTVLIRDVAKTKLAATDTPRASRGPAPGSRRIPATVRRAVWQRDGGQCAFVSASGHRCAERGRLEFHHVVPYAKGGGASVANTELRCRRHNVHEAERDFGPWAGACVRERRPGYGSQVVSRHETPTRDRVVRVPDGSGRPEPRPSECAWGDETTAERQRVSMAPISCRARPGASWVFQHDTWKLPQVARADQPVGSVGHVQTPDGAAAFDSTQARTAEPYRDSPASSRMRSFSRQSSRTLTCRSR